MKKQSLLFLLFVAFAGLVGAQTTAPAPAKPKSSLKQELNPNTDPKNQQTPDPAPTPAPAPTSRNTSTRPATGQPAQTSSRTSTTPPKKTQQPAATPAPSAPAAGTEKQPTESPAAAAKRKLIADGYVVCMTHPEYGKVYCNKSETSGQKTKEATKYFYIDEDGIAVPLDKSAVVKASEGDKKPESKGKPTSSVQKVTVNRWLSPVFNDFTTIPESQSTVEQLVAAGYKTRVFQYQAFLTRPGGDNVAVVNRWEMPNCKEFILIAEHEISDAKMTEWGYKNKQFLFYAYKTKPASGNYVAISRWINTLAASSPCRDFTLSIGEHEATDAQLTSLGYTNKLVQFYVPDPR